MSHDAARIDLHVHTHVSRTAGNWILDQIQVNECYTEPLEVYRIAKNRGMNFVTVTDHDEINGALEIAHLPDVFISEEISAFFPDDQAKVHILAFDITEAQHRDIQKLRFHIYELVDYLNQQQIVHALAHPYFKMGRVLSMKHIEQMLVLFNIFEVKNGGKQVVPDHLVASILQHLTPEKIDQLANKHHIQPVGKTPWKKSQIGGSDDHGGILIASPHTQTPAATSVTELLNHIASGRSQAVGHGGTPLAVAHGAMAVGFKYARTKKSSFDVLHNELAWRLLENIFDEPQHHGVFSLGMAFAQTKSQRLFSPRKKTSSSRAIVKQISHRLKQDPELFAFIKGKRPFDHHTNITFFNIANTIVNEHVNQLFARSKGGSLFDTLSNIIILKNILPLVVPYLVAFKTEHADRPLMRQSANTLLPPDEHLEKKIAVFSDHDPATLLDNDELDDVLQQEIQEDYDLLYFSMAEQDAQAGEFYSYAPVGKLGDSPHSMMPPVLKVAYDFTMAGCDKIYVDTLGPMGVLGVLLGKLVQVPVIATFHETEIQALSKRSGGQTSKFFKSMLSYLYSWVNEIRLLDTPTKFEYEILQKSGSEIKLLHEQVEFEEAEFPMIPASDIF